MANKNPDELLPEDDTAFLKEKYPNAHVYGVGNEVHVQLPSFPFPAAYQPRTADLLVRLPAGYPDAKPDMFWTNPDVKLGSGAWPIQCQYHEIPGSGEGVEVYNKVAWQRWSRHSAPADWRAGIDGLRNFIGAIKRELERQI
jgi:Prokaryotic E2 family E